MRVDADVEARGIDIAKHGEPAYPAAAMGHGWDTEGKNINLLDIYACRVQLQELGIKISSPENFCHLILKRCQSHGSEMKI